jgi:hypothetical protein
MIDSLIYCVGREVLIYIAVDLLQASNSTHITMGFRHLPLALIHSIAVTTVRLTRAPR